MQWNSLIDCGVVAVDFSRVLLNTRQFPWNTDAFGFNLPWCALILLAHVQPPNDIIYTDPQVVEMRQKNSN